MGSAKIFDILFSMDLLVLRCPEHDLTTFRKCLSICVGLKFFGCASAGTNEHNFLKIYHCFPLNMNYNILTFIVYVGTVFSFPKFFG